MGRQLPNHSNVFGLSFIPYRWQIPRPSRVATAFFAKKARLSLGALVGGFFNKKGTF